MDTPRPDTDSASSSTVSEATTSSNTSMGITPSTQSYWHDCKTPEPLPQAPPVLEWSPCIRVLKGNGFVTDDKDPENQIAFQATRAELATLAMHHLNRAYYFRLWYATTRNTGGSERREEFYSEVRFEQIEARLDAATREKFREIIQIRDAYIAQLSEGYVEQELYRLFEFSREDLLPAVTAGNSVCDASQASAEDIQVSQLPNGSWHISISGWKSLTAERARKLATNFEQVHISGLESVSEDAAAMLAQGRFRHLHLEIASLTDEAVASISRCKCDLSLPMLLKLSDRAAQALAGHQGHLTLGVEEVNEQQAKTLATHKGTVLLRGLQRATPRALFWLWRSQNVHVLGALHAPEVPRDEEVLEQPIDCGEVDEEAKWAFWPEFPSDF